MTQLIREYKKLVHCRSEFSGTFSDASEHTAVEESVQNFVDELVDSTYGMLWDATDLPFRIFNIKGFDIDYSAEALILADKLNDKPSLFKDALRQILRMFFEFGSAFVYIYDFPEKKTFCHHVLSLENCNPTYDEFFRLDKVMIGDIRGKKNKEKSLLIARGEEKWTVAHVEGNDLVSSHPLNFQPIFEMSDVRLDNSLFPVGRGLSLLPDIKRFNSLLQSITSGSAELLKPITWRDSSVNVENNGKDSSLNINSANLSCDSEIVADLLGGKQLPFGFLSKPVQLQPAWELFNMLAARLRQKFGLMNRLLISKDDVQQTATEVNALMKQDMNRIRDFSDRVYQFLNELHKAQFQILVNNGEISIPEGISKEDFMEIEFVHNSIFEKLLANEKLGEINMGLDLLVKTVQSAQVLQQAGLNISIQETVEKIVGFTEAVSLTQAQPDIAAQTLQALASMGDMAETPEVAGG